MMMNFRVYVESRLKQVVSRIAQELGAEQKLEWQVKSEVLETWATRAFQMLLASLSEGDDSGVSEMRQLHEEMCAKGWTAADVVTFYNAVRRDLLQVSLEASLEEVAEATVGLRTLVEASDSATFQGVKLIQESAKQCPSNQELKEEISLLHSVINSVPAIIYAKDLDNKYVVVNDFAAGIMNLSSEKIIGKFDHELFPPEVIETWRQREDAILNTHETVVSEDIFEEEDGPHAFLSTLAPILDENGKVYAIVGISNDITELKRAERERIELQEKIIRVQKQTLRDLSTPLLPITDTIVIMPLIGAIDASRSQQMLETLLEGISRSKIETAILDLTGMIVIDTQVASALLRAIEAAGLIGAEVILTGIAPDVAQTFVKLGVDLTDVVTLGSLKSGIAYAMESSRPY